MGLPERCYCGYW